MMTLSEISTFALVEITWIQEKPADPSGDTYLGDATSSDTTYIGEVATSAGTTYPFVSLEPIPPEPSPKWITGTLRTIDDQLTLCITDVLATSDAF